MSCNRLEVSPSAFSMLVVARATAWALSIVPLDSKAAYIIVMCVRMIPAAVGTIPTHARSNRVLRAAYSSTTPMATLTPFSRSSLIALLCDKGGPGKLLDITC